MDWINCWIELHNSNYTQLVHMIITWWITWSTIVYFQINIWWIYRKKTKTKRSAWEMIKVARKINNTHTHTYGCCLLLLKFTRNYQEKPCTEVSEPHPHSWLDQAEATCTGTQIWPDCDTQNHPPGNPVQRSAHHNHTASHTVWQQWLTCTDTAGHSCISQNQSITLHRGW